MGTRAAIFMQRGAPDDRQQKVCFAYAEQRGYQLPHLFPWFAGDQLVKSVGCGAVDVIITAFDSKNVQQLAADVHPRARVEVVHPKPHVVEPPPPRHARSITDLIVRWRRRGKNVPEIAMDIEEDTAYVRRILRSAGEDTGG